MRYDVPPIGERDPATCWAAAFAMILSRAEGRPVSPEAIIVETGSA